MNGAAMASYRAAAELPDQEYDDTCQHYRVWEECDDCQEVWKIAQEDAMHPPCGGCGKRLALPTDLYCSEYPECAIEVW